MLKNNLLKQKLDQHARPVIGSWSVLPSPFCTEILALSGLDFIVMDREHGPANHETIMAQIVACELRGTSPLIRVADGSVTEIQCALDLGAHGIHVPNVRTAEDVKSVIERAKYPPIGNRGFSPFTRAGGYAQENAKALLARANQQTLLIIHVEGKEGIYNLPEILQLPTIDIIFLGAYDLSKSFGKSVDDPVIQTYLREATQQIVKSGKIAGTIVTSEEQMKEYADWGIRYFTYSVDCDVLLNAYKRISSYGTRYSR